MKISIKNFQKKNLISPTRTTKAILKTLRGEKSKLSGEICVSFVSDAKIKALNQKFLRHKGATDVLTFQIGSKNKIFADIVISTETAIRNAKIYKTTPADELELYAVHGTLHLLGYNDSKTKDKLLMRKKESLYAHP